MATQPARPRIAFVTLGAVQAVLILAITIVAIPLPAIQRDLGLSRADLALVSQAYGLSFAGLLLLGGRVADQIGHRRAFRLGVAVFGLASAAAAISPDLGVLLAARFAQGGGAALTAPSAMALLSSVFPDPARRQRATAIWGSLAVTGANAGTLLSGLILTVATWRWVFAIPTAAAVAVTAMSSRLLPPGPPPRRRPLDVPGAVLATTALTGLSYGLAASGDHPWSSAAVLVPLLGGASAMAGFGLVESRTRAPLLPLGLFTSVQSNPVQSNPVQSNPVQSNPVQSNPVQSNPVRTISALVVILLTAAVSGGTTFLLSLYFQQVRALSPLQTSGAFLPFGLVIVSGQLAGRLTPRLGPGRVAATGLGLTSAGLLLASRIGTATPYAGPLLAGLLILPLGMGLAFSGATLAAVDGLRADQADQAALAGGVVNEAMETGPNLGVAIMVAIAGASSARLAAGGLSLPSAAVGGYATAFMSAGITIAVAAAIAAITLHTAPENTAPEKGNP